jgi:protein-tyrosine phosphatase
MEKTLIFVCSGNTCRSPLAWAAWEALPDTPAGFKVLSAGLFASPGAKAAPHSVEIAEQWGVDLSDHHARPLNARLLRDASLLCVMTAEHADVLHTHYDVQIPVVLLGSFQDDNSAHDNEAPSWMELIPDAPDTSILDPFGGSREAYESCAQQIQRAVTNLAAALRDGRLLSTPD